MNKLTASTLIRFVVCKQLPFHSFKDFMYPGSFLLEVPACIPPLFRNRDDINIIFMDTPEKQKNIVTDINKNGGIQSLIESVCALEKPLLFFVSEEGVSFLRRMFLKEKVCIFEHEGLIGSKTAICSCVIDFEQKHFLQEVEPVCFN